MCGNNSSITTQFKILTTLKKKVFENIVRKGEIPCNQHFLLFRTMLSTCPITKFSFLVTFTLSSANAFSSEQTKILSFGNGFRIPTNLKTIERKQTLSSGYSL